jgi:hypothetical protein
VDQRLRRGVVLCVLGAMPSCGSQAVVPVVHPSTEALAPQDESREGLAVSGLLGTLSSTEITRALDPRMPQFARCLGKYAEELPWLSGQLLMAFRVGVDGRVRRVHPAQSDLGDRNTERCLLEVAAATRFPPPHGGEAEFRWSLEGPSDPEVRAPDPYVAVAAALPVLRAAVASCAVEALKVTAYVDDSGRVVAAGVASVERLPDESLDCVVRGLIGLALPSPGSYAAKLQVVLP